MILLTGATGFVGSALMSELIARGHRVKVAARKDIENLSPKIEQCIVSDLSKNTDWSESLTDTNIVIHASARVHQMNESSQDVLHLYRETNVDGTLALAKQAAAAGVGRFIFMSSIKVNGESTHPGEPYLADSTPKPADTYGVTKWEAEQGLMAISSETGMEVVIIRPPLVYGRGAKGNFQTLVNWIKRGVPLPLGLINNKRSFVAIGNLVDFIIACAHHPDAGNETFLVSDGEDISTTELLKRIGRALDKTTYLAPIPPALIIFFATLLGKQAIAQRLCGCLQVDITKAQSLLGWNPPVSIEQGLQEAMVTD